MEFMDYFPTEIEHPDDVALNPLPIGTHYTYISNDFLNAFINHVTIIKSFVLGRYHSWDEKINHAVSVMDPPGSFKWVKKGCPTKNDAYRELTKERAILHANLDSDFEDDVIILAKAGMIGDSETCYVYFWYDRDCSHCCIGRFVTADVEADVVESFVKYVQEELKEDGTNIHGAREIPLHYFSQGWLRG